MSPDLRIGSDGRARCGWVGEDPLYVQYHDREWGVALRGDRAMFEKLCLEGFQAGLSWITILRKREGFREVFEGFDPVSVAAFDEHDVDRLMADARIVRNRAKILATIGNARALGAMKSGELDDLIWSYQDAQVRQQPTSMDDVPAVTPASTALSKELRTRGFRFIGPTTVYALMQSVGIVDDHLLGCWRAARG